MDHSTTAAIGRLESMMATRSQLMLRIPKNETPAILVLAGGERANVVLYLAAGYGVGELLESNDTFVPINFRTGTQLVLRAAIAWISIHSAYNVVSSELPGERQEVLLHLKDGGQVSGELRWVAPLGRRRTLDHLNNEAKVLCLHDGNHVTFVAKDYVVRVEEIGC